MSHIVPAREGKNSIKTPSPLYMYTYDIIHKHAPIYPRDMRLEVNYR